MTDADAPPLVPVDLGPGVRAAFTTAPVNLSPVVGGDPEGAVAARRAVAAWVGAPVAYARQVHGADVHVVDDVPDVDQEAVATADALVTRRTDVGLAVLVADCVPVLLVDAAAGVVATAHAGRLGVVAQVAVAAVETMRAAGAHALRAVVGPAACGRCYEVPQALRDEVDAAVPGSASTTSWGTPALDLPGAVERQLRTAGVVVSRVGGCTIEEDRWFSHRAATGGSRPAAAGDALRPAGRLAGVIRLLGEDRRVVGVR
jgi:polyphenol oxidase